MANMMSSPPRTESESTNWRELYKAAILELDPSKLSQRIADAETAVIQRQRELFQDTGGNIEEEQALDDGDVFPACPSQHVEVQHVGAWR